MEASDAGYAPISDYALIGNMRTCALVGRDGAIDWACFPRFDSPSAFARLLDRRRGGTFRVVPAQVYRSARRYLPGSAVIETTFDTDTGTLRMTDFMPVTGDDRFQVAYFPEIMRRIECVQGYVEVDVLFEPRFDYASSTTRIRKRRGGVLATDEVDEVLALAMDGEFDVSSGADGDCARARFRLDAGEARWAVLRYDDDEVRPFDHYACELRLREATEFWQGWSDGVRYEGPERQVVLRSAITLKLLTHRESGGVIAAATTSLPEAIGAARNWDYRYVWLRDSSFTLRALAELGQKEEAWAFLRFLKRVARRAGSNLQIMYGVGGERHLEERVLPHLEGYRGSAPVRCGNGAYDQLQMDVFGEVLDAAHVWYRERAPSEGTWELLERMADWVAGNWQARDHGIWEHRTEPRAYVFSRALCWVALDRAIGLARRHSLDADTESWQREKEALRADIDLNGWSDAKRSFVQHYETEALDAANLLLGWFGVVEPDDERMLATIEGVRRELVDPETGLVYRYRNEDGLAGDEGAFPICTLWLADALILAGRVDEGREIFHAVAARANDVGLMSEEVARDGAFLGNYPQAYTHIALINTALLLERAVKEGVRESSVAQRG